MRLPRFRLGATVALLGCMLALATTGAAAQDQATLVTAANAGMQQMEKSLAAALSASSESAAKVGVRSAIASGERAVAALKTLVATAADDVVRSRSEAALTQTQSALEKARSALNETGDAFRSRVEAARAEVAEAIAEFAPVLPVAGQAGPAELPKSGEGDLTAQGLLLLALVGVASALAGIALRRRFVPAV